MERLSKKEIEKMNLEQKRKYYDELREYYTGLKENKLAHKVHQIFNPLIKVVAKNLNGTNKDPNKIVIFKNEWNQNNYNGPVIYACNHTNSHDMPFVIEVARNQYYVYAGNEIENDINGALFKLNGVVFVDRTSKEDKRKSFDELLKLSCQGKDTLIFPEATWNVTPSNPMNNIYSGVIETSIISGNPIVPLVTEYTDNKWYMYIGKPIFIYYGADINQAREYLRDTMATMKWTIWESFGQIKREEIPANYYEEYLNKIYTEYPKLDPEFESQFVYKDYVTEEEVFENIKKLTK